MTNSTELQASHSSSISFRNRIMIAATVMQGIAVVWIAVAIWQVSIFWMDRQAITGNFGRRLHVDLSALPAEHYFGAAALVALDVAFSIILAIQIWRLASIYRSGAVFSENAALGLQYLAYAGAVALVADVVIRHAVILILTVHLANGPVFGGFFFTSQDLLYGMMILFIFMLASIFRAAAQMAEEQAAII